MKRHIVLQGHNELIRFVSLGLFQRGRDFHIYKSHPATLSEADRKKLEERYAQPCGMCDFVSWSKKTLQVHRRSEHFGVEWSTHCPACACGVKDRHDLEQHIELKHAQDPNWYVVHCSNAFYDTRFNLPRYETEL